MTEREQIEKIIRPLVIGQLRASANDHPGSVDLKMLASVEKRLVNQLLATETLLRIKKVFVIE